jgi:hypothetical protein
MDLYPRSFCAIGLFDDCDLGTICTNDCGPGTICTNECGSGTICFHSCIQVDACGRQLVVRIVTALHFCSAMHLIPTMDTNTTKRDTQFTTTTLEEPGTHFPQHKRAFFLCHANRCSKVLEHQTQICDTYSASLCLCVFPVIHMQIVFHLIPLQYSNVRAHDSTMLFLCRDTISGIPVSHDKWHPLSQTVPDIVMKLYCFLCVMLS